LQKSTEEEAVSVPKRGGEKRGSVSGQGRGEEGIILPKLLSCARKKKWGGPSFWGGRVFSWPV